MSKKIGNLLMYRLINDLGGMRQVGRDLNIPNSTIWRWTGVGRVPSTRHLLMLEDFCARKKIFIDISKIARASEDWKLSTGQK